MRTSRVLAEALHLVLLVGFEVAFEPVPLRGILVRAFPGEDVSGDPVEEPTVVRHDHGAAGELEKGVLQGSQGLDVEVEIGRASCRERVKSWTVVNAISEKCKCRLTLTTSKCR